RGRRLGSRRAKDAAELGDVARRHLRAEEDTVGESRRAPCRAFALGAHLERRMWLLVRHESHPALADLRVVSSRRHGLAAPQALHQGQGLLELSCPLLALAAGGLELLSPAAHPHPPIPPPPPP